MSFNDEINIVIFKQIQDKIDLLEKIFFTINDCTSLDIKSKDIHIRIVDIKEKNYEIKLFGTTINKLIKNIYNKNALDIDINFCTCAMDLYQIDNFPNFIKKICLRFKFNCEILKNLPEDLEYLNIWDNPKEIKTELNNLPNKLKVLKMSYINYNLPIDNLPESLEKLVLSLKNKYNHNLDNLPSSLNFLEINLLDDTNCICKLNNLPESLKEIKLKNNKGFEIKKYPQKLKILELCSKKEITNIPENIEYKYIK